MGLGLRTRSGGAAIDDAAAVTPDALQADEHIAQFLAVAARIGTRGAAKGPRDAREEFQPLYAVFCGGLGDRQVQCPSAC